MKTWIDYLMAQVRKFNVVDFAFFKMTLLTAGILLGSYFAAFFQGIIAWIWVLFIVSYAALIVAMFRRR